MTMVNSDLKGLNPTVEKYLNMGRLLFFDCEAIRSYGVVLWNALSSIYVSMSVLHVINEL